MAGKATTADLTAEGFRESQFGADAGAGSWAGYLTAVLLRAECWARYKLGDAAYASATSDAATSALLHAYHQIVIAETQYAASLLWERRTKFVDSGAAIGNQGLDYLNRREYIAHATAAMDAAEAALCEAALALGVEIGTIVDGSGVSVGHVETGRYPVASESALNG